MSSRTLWQQLVVSPPVVTDPYRWYAIHTRARHEKMVTTRLQEQGITTFLPTTTEVRRWSDRRKLVEFPLFRHTRVALARSTLPSHNHRDSGADAKVTERLKKSDLLLLPFPFTLSSFYPLPPFLRFCLLPFYFYLFLIQWRRNPIFCTRFSLSGQSGLWRAPKNKGFLFSRYG